MRLETYTFDDDGRIPDSVLPVLLYRAALECDAGAAAFERLFARHRWLGAWRDGIYDFHHFHSTTHEVLGVARGGANVILGGPHGRRFELLAGDVVVLPARTGHCNAGSDAGLLVVGAYPNGMRWDIRRGDPASARRCWPTSPASPSPTRIRCRESAARWSSCGAGRAERRLRRSPSRQPGASPAGTLRRPGVSVVWRAIDPLDPHRRSR
jgi:uncharacterized protein YjlB